MAERVGGPADPHALAVPLDRPVARLRAVQPVEEEPLSLALKTAEPEDLAFVQRQLPRFLPAVQAHVTQLERRRVRTRGPLGREDRLDVAAGHQADGGAACVLYSSDTEELVGLCDRIAVFHDGVPALMLEGDEITQDAVVAASFAVVREAQ